MDRYVYIDDLVSRCKSGDKEAKNILAEEYYNMAKNLSNQYIRRNKINEYDIDEIINECLFKVVCSVDRYKVGGKTFTAYAKVVIINRLEDIGRSVGVISKTHGFDSLIIDEIFENTLEDKESRVEDKVYKKELYKSLSKVLKKLDEEEFELIEFIFFKKKPVMRYSEYKNIPYMHAIRFRNKILNKLKRLLEKEGYTEI